MFQFIIILKKKTIINQLNIKKIKSTKKILKKIIKKTTGKKSCRKTL